MQPTALKWSGQVKMKRSQQHCKYQLGSALSRQHSSWCVITGTVEVTGSRKHNGLFTLNTGSHLSSEMLNDYMQAGSKVRDFIPIFRV